MPRIIVDVRKVYGKTVVYPHCRVAKLLAELAGTKTLTADALVILTKLDYEFVMKPLEMPV